MAGPPKLKTMDANEAVALMAYRLSEVISIYPITPASTMGEHADAWAAARKPNLWGGIPDVIEMQSEAGAAGAVHGALQCGSLATTFTSSQGLLLMLPVMYKVAGELTPFCMHVAARSLATHALSIFGDHSDVMSARSTGFALLASNTAQEAQDLAVIAHASTLKSRIPFLHFFDGFRTSHEISRVLTVDNDVLRAMIDEQSVREHRGRALSPEKPFIRGTSQNPDVFFQSREAANGYYDRCADVVTGEMERFAALTGRRYQPFEYVGDPQAERVIVLMGSAAECAHEAVGYLNRRGGRTGIVKVRLYRPFSVRHLLPLLPETVRKIAVLDRCKEPGAPGEPLFLDIVSAMATLAAEGRRAPSVIGGRYGLGSKEFTPAMVMAVFDELARPGSRRQFTVGIRDDVTGLSLEVDPELDIEPDDVTRAVFYGLGSDGTVSANKSSIKIIGEQTELHAQGYFEYDSKKSGSTTISHLRFGPNPIRSTYRISRAQFVAVHTPEFLEQLDVFSVAAAGATVLLNSPLPAEKIWESLPLEAQEKLIQRRCRLFAIDASKVAVEAGLGRRINTVMQVCFFALSKVLPMEKAMAFIRRSIEETFGRRGEEIVKRNIVALEASLACLREIPVPARPSTARRMPPVVPVTAPDFVRRVTGLIIDGKGDLLPVSALPVDGTWPSGTSRFEKRAIAFDIPIWQPDICVQCNKCVMICPHAAIRAKVFTVDEIAKAPAGFRSAPQTYSSDLEGLTYAIQVAPDGCTGCGLCVEVCPARDRKQPKRKALVSEPLAGHRDTERICYDFFQSIPSALPADYEVDDRSAGFRTPLFEFSGACAGCGETPYIRLLTQLFGDRLVIANATGCSSIYGGNLPTTPYTTNRQGKGPAWANSLFEDNAEFGLGMRLAIDAGVQQARSLLNRLADRLPPERVKALLATPAGTDTWIEEQRTRVADLRRVLWEIDSPDSRELDQLAENLIPRSVWIIGGDGWAYDIGYGGLDHILASRKNVKILVLDTEVYSNTGGQQSKATPIGASAKFATAGKETAKKDLGMLAMTYGDVYVAQVALQWKSSHTVKAFQEAESYSGTSLIIAHCPCIAHGYDLSKSPAQQGRAVKSGVWPLYRFDPRLIQENRVPLTMDSPKPTVDVSAYMENEARFRMVQMQDPERYKRLVDLARDQAKRKQALYEQAATIHLPKRDDHG